MAVRNYRPVAAPSKRPVSVPEANANALPSLVRATDRRAITGAIYGQNPIEAYAVVFFITYYLVKLNEKYENRVEMRAGLSLSGKKESFQL